MSDQSTSAHIPQQAQVEYRDISGHVGYRIGNDGSVWCCRPRSGRGPIADWRPVKPVRYSNGYMVVTLGKGVPGKLIHRLVLEAFVGPCLDGMVCRHLDGNKQNNHISNLCWGTVVENNEDQVRHGTRARGSRSGNSKLKEDQIAIIRTLLAYGFSQSEVGQVVGVSQSTIGKISIGCAWSHVK